LKREKKVTFPDKGFGKACRANFREFLVGESAYSARATFPHTLFDFVTASRMLAPTQWARRERRGLAVRAIHLAQTFFYCRIGVCERMDQRPTCRTGRQILCGGGYAAGGGYRRFFLYDYACFLVAGWAGYSTLCRNLCGDRRGRLRILFAAELIPKEQHGNGRSGTTLRR